MKIGTVLGKVGLSIAAPGFANDIWMQVRMDDQVLVAADITGVKAGDLVLVLQGVGADRYRQDLRCYALIVGKVDNLK